MKTLLMLAALLIPASSHAAGWNLGFTGQAGVLEEQPATAIAAEFQQHNIHTRLRFQAWTPEDELGRWELGLEGYVHSGKCEAPSLYAGAGVGAEWLTEPVVAKIPCPTAPPPAPVDPPSSIFTLFGGVRYPTEYIDYHLEARNTWDRDGVPRFGPFLGVTLHQERQEGRRGHPHTP
jgi:hypothetical protein